MVPGIDYIEIHGISTYYLFHFPQNTTEEMLVDDVEVSTRTLFSSILVVLSHFLAKRKGFVALERKI